MLASIFFVNIWIKFYLDFEEEEKKKKIRTNYGINFRNWYNWFVNIENLHNGRNDLKESIFSLFSSFFSFLKINLEYSTSLMLVNDIKLEQELLMWSTFQFNCDSLFFYAEKIQFFFNFAMPSTTRRIHCWTSFFFTQNLQFLHGIIIIFMNLLKNCNCDQWSRDKSICLHKFIIKSIFTVKPHLNHKWKKCFTYRKFQWKQDEFLLSIHIRRHMAKNSAGVGVFFLQPRKVKLTQLDCRYMLLFIHTILISNVMGLRWQLNKIARCIRIRHRIAEWLNWSLILSFKLASGFSQDIFNINSTKHDKQNCKKADKDKDNDRESVLFFFLRRINGFDCFFVRNHEKKK